MLKLKNINKSFGQTQVLFDVDLEIKNKKVVALLGPNGAGKTTVMRIITGFLTPNSGEVQWDQETVNTADVEYKKQIGYLPENNPLYGWMTVGEYLKFISNLKSGYARGDEILKVASECGIEDVVGKKIEILSKGYKQRVGLAAALLGDPKLLVLDEPTSGLDPNQILEIRALIKKLAKEKSVILSTHILPEAKAICDDIIIINRGQIVLNEISTKVKNLEKKFVDLTT
ncbi:ABC transporter ATP-binding protein [Patescibacteria group bacterium]|nr:ABC transporter ATP-binding protein [Patescibacteria group bacterium]